MGKGLTAKQQKTSKGREKTSKEKGSASKGKGSASKGTQSCLFDGVRGGGEARASRGPFLASIDADCRVFPTLLALVFYIHH